MLLLFIFYSSYCINICIAFGNPDISSNYCQNKRNSILADRCNMNENNVTPINCNQYYNNLNVTNIALTDKELNVTDQTSYAYIIGISVLIIISIFFWTYKSRVVFKQSILRKRLKMVHRVLSSPSLTTQSMNSTGNNSLPDLQLDLQNHSNTNRPSAIELPSPVLIATDSKPNDNNSNNYSQNNNSNNFAMLTKDNSKATQMYLQTFFDRKDVKLSLSDYLDVICRSIGDAFKSANNKRAMYLSLIPHILDTATDIGVCIHFYYLAKTQDICQIKINHLNANVLFILSVLSMSVYRIFTACYLVILSKYLSIPNKIKQFVLCLLDLEIIRVIRINFVLNRDRPCNPQRLIHVLEACLESAPQGIIQTVYLWHTQQFLDQFRLTFFVTFFLFCIVWTCDTQSPMSANIFFLLFIYFDSCKTVCIFFCLCVMC